MSTATVRPNKSWRSNQQRENSTDAALASHSNDRRVDSAAHVWGSVGTRALADHGILQRGGVGNLDPDGDSKRAASGAGGAGRASGNGDGDTRDASAAMDSGEGKAAPANIRDMQLVGNPLFTTRGDFL